LVSYPHDKPLYINNPNFSSFLLNELLGDVEADDIGFRHETKIEAVTEEVPIK
jgi:hypothetical protein